MKFIPALALFSLFAIHGHADTTNTPPPDVVSTNVLAPAVDAPDTVRALVAHLSKMHVSGRKFDDTIADRALDIFLNSLDSDHSYFIEPDLETASELRLELDDQLLAGDVQIAYDLFQVFKERVRDRTSFVTNLLAADMDVTVDESYIWKRKDEPWALDEAEWNDLWRKKIKNEYVGAMVARHLRDIERAEKEAARTNALATATNTLTSVTNAVPDDATAETPGDSDAEDENVAQDDAGEDNGDEATEEEKPEKSIAETIIARYERFAKSVEDIEPPWVLDQYLSAFSRGYDPHCDYMAPAAAEEFNIEISLSLVGIGAMLRLEGGTTEIVRIMPGGPADRDDRPVQLEKGDRIIAVAQGDEDFVDVRNWPLSKIVRLIRGEKGTVVRLKVIPVEAPTDDETKIVDLVRDEIKLEDRGARKKIYDTHGADGEKRRIGVISLPAFYGDIRNANDDKQGKSCAKDVERLLLELGDEQVDGVILNLRSNSGGSLREAGLMTGLFIPQGPVVIIKDGSGASILPDTNPKITYAGPLAILVNRHTASAGEILAGALQDYGRAIVVGDSRTHGKGTVQTVRQLGEKGKLGSIKVTNAQFYRITGSSTQLKGVTSDIWVPSPYDYTRTGEERLPYALEWSMTKRSRYQPFAQMTGANRELNRLSGERLADSEHFGRYTNLLSQLEAINQEETLPLQFEERLERARTRTKLKKLQEEYPAEEDDVENDLVLTEALHVASDLVTLSPKVDAWPGYTPRKPISVTELDATVRARVEHWIDTLKDDDAAVRNGAVDELEALQNIVNRILESQNEGGTTDVLELIREKLQDAE